MDDDEEGPRYWHCPRCEVEWVGPDRCWACGRRPRLGRSPAWVALRAPDPVAAYLIRR